MTYNRSRHLPVLEALELVGMVSIGDLVNSIIADQADTIEELHRTLGEVRRLGSRASLLENLSKLPADHPGQHLVRHDGDTRNDVHYVVELRPVAEHH